MSSGGTTYFTRVDSGGSAVVAASGETFSDVVRSGGAEVIGSGGTAVSTTLSAGAYLFVLPGGNQTGTVSAGGSAVSTGVVLYQPGSGFTSLGLVATGSIVGSGGVEYVLEGGTTSFEPRLGSESVLRRRGQLLPVFAGGIDVSAVRRPRRSARVQRRHRVLWRRHPLYRGEQRQLPRSSPPAARPVSPQ